MDMGGADIHAIMLDDPFPNMITRKVDKPLFYIQITQWHGYYNYPTIVLFLPLVLTSTSLVITVLEFFDDAE